MPATSAQRKTWNTGVSQTSLTCANPSGDESERPNELRSKGISKKTRTPEIRCKIETKAITGNRMVKGLMLIGLLLFNLPFPEYAKLNHYSHVAFKFASYP